jgi:hypothetical protein
VADLIFDRPAPASTDLVFGADANLPDAVEGTAAGTLEVAGGAVGEHIDVPLLVEGTGEGAFDITGAAQAGHGVAGTGATTLGLAGTAAGVVGVSGAAAGGLGITGAAQGIHERYELRGEVRQAGILVDRRVRAYDRASGALIGQADTTFGRFAIHTGFVPGECYIVPIHLDSAATDWTPPTANRVLSVLAMDAA